MKGKVEASLCVKASHPRFPTHIFNFREKAPEFLLTLLVYIFRRRGPFFQLRDEQAPSKEQKPFDTPRFGKYFRMKFDWTALEFGNGVSKWGAFTFSWLNETIYIPKSYSN